MRTRTVLNRQFVAFCLPWTALLLWAPLGRAAVYTITDLGTLGGSYSEGLGINDAGQVTGYSRTSGDAASHAFRYTSGVGMENLGTGSNSRSSLGFGINDAGQVTGRAITMDGRIYAFVYTSGVGMQDLGTLGGTRSGSAGLSINDAGQVAGVSHTSDEEFAPHAFRYTPGVGMQDLGILGGPISEGYAINDAGQVAGTSTTTSWTSDGFRVQHAFLYTSAMGMRDLGTLGGTYSSGYAINNAGQVTGAAQTSGDATSHAFLYTSEVGMRDLGTLGGTDSVGLGINDAGEVVGGSLTSGNAQRAFLYTGGSMIDLNDLLPAGSGWTLTLASDINNFGQITGVGIHNGQERAFLLTRVAESTAAPEPSTLTIFALGGIGLAISAARRRRTAAHGAKRRLTSLD